MWPLCAQTTIWRTDRREVPPRRRPCTGRVQRRRSAPAPCAARRAPPGRRPAPGSEHGALRRPRRGRAHGGTPAAPRRRAPGAAVYLGAIPDAPWRARRAWNEGRPPGPVRLGVGRRRAPPASRHSAAGRSQRNAPSRLRAAPGCGRASTRSPPVPHGSARSRTPTQQAPSRHLRCPGVRRRQREKLPTRWPPWRGPRSPSLSPGIPAGGA